MGRILSPVICKASCSSRPARFSCWGCIQHRAATRSHVAAASAAPDAEPEGRADRATEKKLDIAIGDTDVGSELEVVEDFYAGVRNEDAMAEEYGLKRDENGDIVFAQLNEEGKLSFAPDLVPYDPMFHGKWVEIDGVEVRMPDYDFSQHDWVMRVESDIGWPMFWRHFEDLTSTDDEFAEGEQVFTESGRLALHSESKRQEALEAQEVFAGSPMMAAPGMDVAEPNQIDEPTVVDRDRRGEIDEWELRAIREKQLAREQWDFYWTLQQMERMDMLNHPPDEQRDVRYMAKLRNERFDWTEEEIHDVVTNEGRSVDPNIVLNAPTFKTLNPYHMPDYASQGIPYMDDMEDWIEQEGRWMAQQNLSEVGIEGDSEDDLSLEYLASAPDEDALDPTIDGIEDEDISVTDDGAIVRNGEIIQEADGDESEYESE